LKRGAAVEAAWTLSGGVIGCLLVGYMIGEYTATNPTAAVTGLGIGLVVGFYSLAKAMGLFG